MFRELYIAPAGLNRRPVGDPDVRAAISADARNILVNLDGVRSYATRRLVVDALERAHGIEAYLALAGARAEIAATLPTSARSIAR
ncbi:MAG: hypothetical protein ACTHU0_37495 [Kofleriaceae bacterium]